MPQEISKISILDLDVYGRTSINGGALVHRDDFAISNAIIFFLTCKKGDYLYRPQLGGILDRLLFKLLSTEQASYFASEISNALDLEFGALVSDIDVAITPNFEERYYEISVFYISTQTRESNQAVFYTKTKDNLTLTKIYTPVDFIDDNLLAFVALEKERVDDKLIFNPTDELWYWGKYKFTNFNEGSSNFQEIFDIING